MDRSDVSFTFRQDPGDRGKYRGRAVSVGPGAGGDAAGYLRRDRVSGAGKARPGREDPAGQIRGAQPGHRAAVFPVGGYIRGPVPKKGPGLTKRRISAGSGCGS